MKKIKPETFISTIRKTGNGLSLYLPKGIITKLGLEDKKNFKLRGYLRVDGFLVFDTNLMKQKASEIKQVAESFDKRRNQEKRNDLVGEIATKVVNDLKEIIVEGIKIEPVVVKESKKDVTTTGSLEDDLKFVGSFDTRDLAKKIK